MKHLVRIVLVNWYRIEQLVLDIEGHTAVIGPNASGKSSLLDAIQAALVGGDKNWWSPNASAGDKSTRSLRDYCLGVVREGDDADISMDLRARDHALTYIALVFRDDAHGDSVSLGLAMHARREDSQEHIDGRFIIEGIELNLSDFIDRHADGGTPKPWKRVQSDFQQRCGKRYQSFPQSNLFQRQLCAVLSGGNRHIDQDRFRRAFKNAITFLPIRNVSTFVRKYILEERPIRVKDLQQALQRYRDIRKRTREAQEREQQLKSIDELYQRAEKAERQALAWRWVQQEASFNSLVAKMEPLYEEMSLKATNIAQIETNLKLLDVKWEQADAAHNESLKKLGATNAAQRKSAIAAELRAALAEGSVVEDKLQRTRSDLQLVFSLLDHASLLGDNALHKKLQVLPTLLNSTEDMLTQQWPANPRGVIACIAELKPGLTQTAGRLQEQEESLIKEMGELESKLAELQTRIKRLEGGESDLSIETQALQRLLAEHGIDSTPLCDEVDVKDETWRAALEAFLGGHREALLVAPDQVREAILLYRKQGRQLRIHGSRIINTLKTADWANRTEESSLAEKVLSNSPHAIAYINRQAGRVICVDTEKELLQHERAVTQDLMLATGGSVSRMKPVESLLGRGAREEMLANLKEQFQLDGKNYYQRKDSKNTLQNFQDKVLGPFIRAVTVLPDLESLCEQRHQKDAMVDKLRREEAAFADDGEHQRLEQEVAELREQRDAIHNDRKQQRDNCNRLEREQTDLKNSLAHEEIQLKEIEEFRRKVTEIPGFNVELATAHMTELEKSELFAEDHAAASYAALADDAGARAGRHESLMKSSRNAARTGVQEYVAKTNVSDVPKFDFDEDYQPLAAWVMRTLTNLRETQLAQYVVEAENALREAEHSFRSDFIGKLQDNLNHLEEQRRELNHNLKHRPFHGQYYQFTREAETDLRSVLKWVEAWTQEEGSQVGSLFDTGADPNHPHREAIERVKNMFMETGDSNLESGDDWTSRLADYRQYYHFDVRMTDDADGRGNPELLSRRLGKGSGGEHQSPFYVAIGASLASAYRIERDKDGGHRGGLCLAMFDEAFSKLDVQNAANALHFLGDLGLQVILAAPDEKYGQLAEHVNTIINVYRDGGAVFMEAEYIKPATHELLAADNPVPIRTHE